MVICAVCEDVSPCYGYALGLGGHILKYGSRRLYMTGKLGAIFCLRLCLVILPLSSPFTVHVASFVGHHGDRVQAPQLQQTVSVSRQENVLSTPAVQATSDIVLTFCRRSVISTLPEIDDALPRDMPRSFKEDNLKQYLEQADLWLNHLSMKPVGYTFESIPILIPTQWEADRSKRISRASQSSTTSTSSSISAQFFERLPREIHHCILNQLKHLHGEPSHICPGCWQRDLYSLSLVSRGWSRVAREQL